MSDPSVPVATPPIIFYVPEYPEDRSLPGTEIAPWLRQWVDLVGTAAIHGKGQMAWTLHTFICLRERGLACRLTREIPERGIIIAHRDAFPAALRPSRRQLFVCLKADRRQHPFAQVHVVANSSDMSGRNLSFADRLLFPGQRHFLPHWQQPGLRPRSSARGDRFENAAFVGHPWNLAPELRDAAWKERLRALGLNWRMVPPEEWNDFNDIDVIVAIRSFSKTDFFWKPAQKLYNAWAAGVPAVLGQESAFRHERRNDLDFLEVDSAEATYRALARLQGDPELRHAMVRNGHQRARETDTLGLANTWLDLIDEVLLPAYRKWTGSARFRDTYFLRCFLANKGNAMLQRLGLPAREGRLSRQIN